MYLYVIITTFDFFTAGLLYWSALACYNALYCYFNDYIEGWLLSYILNKTTLLFLNNAHTQMHCAGFYIHVGGISNSSVHTVHTYSWSLFLSALSYTYMNTIKKILNKRICQAVIFCAATLSSTSPPENVLFYFGDGRVKCDTFATS